MTYPRPFFTFNKLRRQVGSTISKSFVGLKRVIPSLHWRQWLISRALDRSSRACLPRFELRSSLDHDARGKFRMERLQVALDQKSRANSAA